MATPSEIEELQALIEKTEWTKAVHVETVPVIDTLIPQARWEGEVEVFDLVRDDDGPKRVYAWTWVKEDGSREHVVVPHVAAIVTPLDAVRAFMQRFTRGSPKES